jgi:hypothetical protein
MFTSLNERCLYVIKLSNSAWNYWILQLFLFEKKSINPFNLLTKKSTFYMQDTEPETTLENYIELIYLFPFAHLPSLSLLCEFIFGSIKPRILYLFGKSWLHFGIWQMDTAFHSLQIYSASQLHQHHVPCNFSPIEFKGLTPHTSLSHWMNLKTYAI